MYVVFDIQEAVVYRWFEEEENANDYCEKLSEFNKDRFKVMNWKDKIDKFGSCYEREAQERIERNGRLKPNSVQEFYDYSDTLKG